MSEGKCPVAGHHPVTKGGVSENQRWWPNQLDLTVLEHDGANLNPYGEDFSYPEAFAGVDFEALCNDILALMTTSQDWWPADYGHYGPLFIRMAWHSAGTYRIHDGRGGAGAGILRFAPLNSWPDNVNLDKARMLLWPIKQKYGRAISWADLMVLTGTLALESMGLPTYGFAAGREDAWEPADDVYWGPEETWLGDERYTGDRELENPLGAVQMGLIYVNPEGPNANPDALLAARDIRETFRRMAMNDEETVALIAGGHTFGKAHGAGSADNLGAEPEAAGLEQQSLGWTNAYKTGVGADTITSGLEGAWTNNPIAWDNNYFENLFSFEWEQTKSPAGATQWRPANGAASDAVPDAHDATRRHAPMMFTTDLALRVDPAYEAISRRFLENPDEFADAFARAWFKLTHRDMGPRSRYLGPLVPREELVWQDPVAAAPAPLSAGDLAELASAVRASGLTTAQLVRTAWASASTFRGTDKRGGANGARVRLAPQRQWAVNNPSDLDAVLAVLETIRANFANASRDISLADLIVFAGGVAVEDAAAAAAVAVKVPFRGGRGDATAEMTDVESFSVLEPAADGFRNYYGPAARHSAEEMFLEKAQFLTLHAPEMVALLGGLRVLGANYDGSSTGVFTDRPGVLSNDFFTNLLTTATVWEPTSPAASSFVGRDRASGVARWEASRVDLLVGSNTQLRAIAEVYASRDGQAQLVHDFVAAWNKVMELDRFDLA